MTLTHTECEYRFYVARHVEFAFACKSEKITAARRGPVAASGSGCGARANWAIRWPELRRRGLANAGFNRDAPAGDFDAAFYWD